MIKLMATLLAASSVAFVAGCASGARHPQVESSTGAAQAVASGNGDDVVCVQQHSTGSHLAHVICTTREEREAGKNTSRNAMRQMQRSGPRNSSLPNQPPGM